MKKLLHRLLTELPDAIHYALAAAALILSQHGLVALAFYGHAAPLAFDRMFWLFPIRQLAMLPGISPLVAIGGFAFCLAISTALVFLSLRRADRLGRGGGLALLTMVPTIQIFAAFVLTLLWRRRASAPAPERVGNPAPPHQLARGTVAGMALIVLAVAVSGATMGAYGWGLFVLTPFLVGVITGYIVNRGPLRSRGETLVAVALAGLLGTLALLMLALEGLLCILLIAPLAAGLAIVGGLIGRGVAKPLGPQAPLYSVAALPLVFLVDAAMPPELPIVTRTSITIAAPPGAVWASLTANRPVAESPGLVGLAGLAYPVASRIAGEGEGAHRIGTFSTGTADERITVWKPGRTLAFRVVRQPPAMEEMSPYRKLHTPHLIGTFDTGETRFDMVPLPGGRTRLTARADHVLRIDPGLYWEPIARWAIQQNVTRVLTDVRRDAESRVKVPRHEARAAAHSPHGQSYAQLAN